jgi:threonine/homoserine/homoserine lactone efflux protein
MNELILLWFAWIIAGGSPGPATLSIAGTSMESGRRSGFFMSLGILAGSAFWGLTAAFGMSAIMLANAWIFETLRYVAAAYLLYLAFKSLRSAFSSQAGICQKAFSGSLRQIFTRGALIHLTNPKAILSWGAVYAIAVAPNSGAVDLLWMFGFLFSGSILIFVGYAFLFSTKQMVSYYQRMRKAFELAFAVLFGAASLKILTTRL